MVKKKSTPETATVRQLAAEWNIAEESVYKFLRHPNAPARNPDGTWPRREVLEYRERQLQRIASRTAPAADSLAEARKTKVLLECLKLRTEIDKLRGELVSRQEIIDLLSELALLTGAVFDQWTSEVAGLTGDAHLVEEAERLTGRMRARLREEVRARREPA